MLQLLYTGSQQACSFLCIARAECCQNGRIVSTDLNHQSTRRQFVVTSIKSWLAGFLEMYGGLSAQVAAAAGRLQHDTAQCVRSWPTGEHSSCSSWQPSVYALRHVRDIA